MVGHDHPGRTLICKLRAEDGGRQRIQSDDPNKKWLPSFRSREAIFYWEAGSQARTYLKKGKWPLRADFRFRPPHGPRNFSQAQRESPSVHAAPIRFHASYAGHSQARLSVLLPFIILPRKDHRAHPVAAAEGMESSPLIACNRRRGVFRKITSEQGHLSAPESLT